MTAKKASGPREVAASTSTATPSTNSSNSATNSIPATKKTSPTRTSPVKKSATKSSATEKVPAGARSKTLTKTAKPPTKSAKTAETSAKASVTTEKTTPTTEASPVAGTATAERERNDPSATTSEPQSLQVRSGEDPWTAEEVAEVRTELEAETARLQEQVESSSVELVGLLRDRSDGAGRDPADVGSTNFERDQEISLANNAREMLEQSQLALKHLAAGTYGVCDNCGQAIGKGRLQAFPRATLCMSCKQREERR